MLADVFLSFVTAAGSTSQSRNGILERRVQVVKSIIGRLRREGSTSRLGDLVFWAVSAANSTPFGNTGYTPGQIAFGQPCILAEPELNTLREGLSG